MTTTGGMARGGYYDDHSEYQRRVAATGDDLIRDAIDTIPTLARDASFLIADYGCSTGRNSLASVRAAVDAVRGPEALRGVVALHNDLPTNDWNTLFANLSSDPRSYVHAAGPPVIPLASAVSFFEPAAPAHAVHLGVSFSAAHWLRRQPDVAVDGFYFCEADDGTRAVLAAQADADWTAFLEGRAADLAPGGRLLVQMVGTDVDAAGDAHVTARQLLRAMAEVAHGMAAEGLLEQPAVDDYVLPVYARTVAELRGPLERTGSHLASAFTVEVARIERVANPYLDQWKQDHDAAKYASAYAAFVRGFTESSLRAHLFASTTSGSATDDLVDQFFRRLQDRFAADPEADAFEDWTLTLVVARA